MRVWGRVRVRDGARVRVGVGVWGGIRVRDVARVGVGVGLGLGVGVGVDLGLAAPPSKTRHCPRR